MFRKVNLFTLSKFDDIFFKVNVFPTNNCIKRNNRKKIVIYYNFAFILQDPMNVKLFNIFINGIYPPIYNDKSIDVESFSNKDTFEQLASQAWGIFTIDSKSGKVKQYVNLWKVFDGASKYKSSHDKDYPYDNKYNEQMKFKKDIMNKNIFPKPNDVFMKHQLIVLVVGIHADYYIYRSLNECIAAYIC